tara:strand:- start:642 stop:1106 length:465 start_codon:yes stop_codon:yes gene_type:complete
MLSLLGSALGFGTSIIPSVIDLFKQRQADKQELAMLQAKARYAAQLSELKIDELRSKSDIAEIEGIHKSQAAAVSNSTFAAALSGSVRPIVTYLFVGIFLTVKITALVTAMKAGQTLNDAMPIIWDQDTQILFSGIISFWFGHRAFEKIRQRKG